MSIAITAIGTATPPHKGSQLQVVEFMGEALQLSTAQKRRLKTLYEGTGINYRHTVIADFTKPCGEFTFFPNNRDDPFPSTAQRMHVYRQHALPLALHAIENCLENNENFNRNEITHLIVVSCTGMYAPGIDIQIIERLKLPTTIQRTAINFMGCYGAFSGIKMAHAICRGDPHANVLVVCIELCTIHFQKNKSMESLVSSAIFSDGAGAVLVQANPNRKKYLSLENFYCDLLPESSEDMTWHIGDQGFDMNLSMYVPRCIETGIKKFVEILLEKQKMTFSEIDFFAIHPGGFKILEACEQALQITPEQNRYSYQVLQGYGNMSSPTIIFVLEKLWQDLTTKNHRNSIFSCAFGPGLTLESILLRVNYV